MLISEISLYRKTNPRPEISQRELGKFKPSGITRVVQKSNFYIGTYEYHSFSKLITIWLNDPRNPNTKSSDMIGRGLLEKKVLKYWGISSPLLRKDWVGKGYGVLFYEYALDDLYLRLMSDSLQTPGGASIWVALAKNPKYKIECITTTNEIKPVQLVGNQIMLDDKSIYEYPDIRGLTARHA